MRLFISINLDDEMCDAVLAVRREIERRGVRGNFTRRENLHLTLAFIGEYPDPDAVADVMKSVPFTPCRLTLDGIGSFGELWWLGVGVPDRLSKYVTRLRRALTEAEIPVDRKKFSPHVTLIRRPDRAAIPPVEIPRASMEAAGVSLMRSDRGKHGMIYTEIAFIK